MPRGQKSCPACHTLCGPRTHTCPSCQHPFKSAQTSGGPAKKQLKDLGEPITDWHNLKKKDFVMIQRGTGPWRTTESGEIEYLGYVGLYRVVGLREDGFMAYPVSLKKTGGFSYVYMGDSRDGVADIAMEPHVIRKVELDELPRKYKL